MRLIDVLFGKGKDRKGTAVSIRDAQEKLNVYGLTLSNVLPSIASYMPYIDSNEIRAWFERFDVLRKEKDVLIKGVYCYQTVGKVKSAGVWTPSRLIREPFEMKYHSA